MMEETARSIKAISAKALRNSITYSADTRYAALIVSLARDNKSYIFNHRFAFEVIVEELIEAGFEYVCTHESLMLFRKRK